MKRDLTMAIESASASRRVCHGAVKSSGRAVSSRAVPAAHEGDR